MVRRQETGGRQMPKNLTDLRSIARSHTQMAIRVLAGIARQKNAPAAARVTACSVLLDRGWGKPEQPHVGGDKDIVVKIRQVLGKDDDGDGEE